MPQEIVLEKENYEFKPATFYVKIRFLLYFSSDGEFG